MSPLSAAVLSLSALLALVLGGLFVVGSRPRDFQLSVRVEAPAERVFQHLVDPDLLRTWLGGLVETRALTDGGPGVGARSVDVIREGGRDIEMISEIIEYDPPHRMVVDIRGPGVHTVSEYVLNDGDVGGTRVSLRQTARFEGVARFMGPFLGRVIESRLKDDLERLSDVAGGSG